MRVLPLLALLGAASCGSPPGDTKCPSTCQGCCSDERVCQAGTLPAACGSFGGMCMACTPNQICQLGACVFVSSSGGGGGSVGGGGGSMGGGGGSTGGGAGTCSPTCPTGYACNSSLACAGGNPQGLQLDVKAFTVSGLVTLNGAQPTSSCGSATRATVTFDDAANGYRFSIPVPCDGATSPFAFSGNVYPGTYRVSVSGGSSNLPQGSAYVAIPALVVS